MIALKAHYDGKVIVPDEPLALAANQKLRIQIEPINPSTDPTPAPKRLLRRQPNAFTYIAPDFDK